MRYHESISYGEAVRAGQQSWQERRRTGLRSLGVRHQTIDLPERWTDRLQTSVLEGLPVRPSVRDTLRREHPPLMLGWSLGTDHREITRGHTGDIISSTIEIPLHIRHMDDYQHGILWINEVMTGQAAVDVQKHLLTQSKDRKRHAFPKAFIERGLTKTQTILPSQVAKFDELMDDPDIRAPLLDAWFSGDHRRADFLIRKHTRLTLNLFTRKLGKSGRYGERKTSRPPESADSAHYSLMTGVAYAQTPIAWFIPAFAALNVAALSIRPRDILTIGLNTVLAIVTGRTIRTLLPIVPTMLMHETIHYFAEGDGHIGWYPARYYRKRNVRS